MTSSTALTRVSVALCTHNGAQFVAEQIDSVLDQEFSPSQVVLSDDASTDATVQIVRERFAARNGHGIELVVIENAVALGVTANFEQAVLACSGELIALCDQDDVWRPDRLAVAIAEFGARPDLLLLHSDARLVDERGEPLGRTLFEVLSVTPRDKRLVHSGRAFDALLRRNLVTGATTVLRRDLVARSTPFPSEWVHDEWLGVLASVYGTVDLVDLPLIDYRQHDSNQIGARRVTLRVGASQLRQSRAQRLDRLIDRSRVLLDRVRAEATSPVAVVEALELKVRHLERRRALPAHRLLRLPGVLAGVMTGGYRRNGRALYDVARDLLQRG